VTFYLILSYIEEIIHNLSTNLRVHINDNLFSFPGLTATDDLLSLIKLMISRSPDNSIAASVVFNATQWPCTLGNITCPRGFVLDASNSVCYFVLPDLTSGYSDILCPESTLVQFYNDAEINGFVNLLKSGLLF